MACKHLDERAFGLEAACVGAAAGRLLAGHHLVVIGDLRLAQQKIIESYFTNGALEPGVLRHGANINRAVVSLWHHVVLTHAAGLPVRGVIPLYAIDPNVDRPWVNC